MTHEEAMKLVERIAKYPAPCTHEQAKRALIKYYLQMLETHLKTK